MRALAKRVGVDRSVAFTVANRLWALCAGVVSALLIVHFLTAAEQGFYYTFTSLIGLRVFIELGLAFVVLQFASHEKGELTWTTMRTLEDPNRARNRLASLARFSLVWYGAGSFLLLVVVLPIGWAVLSSNSAPGIEWKSPWVVTVIISTACLPLMPLFAIIEGCGRVADVALYRLAQGVVASLAVWIALATGLRLFAAPAFSLVVLVTAVGCLGVRYRRFFHRRNRSTAGTARKQPTLSAAAKHWLISIVARWVPIPRPQLTRDHSA